MEVAPIGRPHKFNDIPGPKMVRADSQQLGFGVGGIAALVTAFAAGTMGFEQAIHGAHGAQLAALVEQSGVYDGKGHVGKALAA